MPANAPVKLLNVQALRAYGALAVAYYHTGFIVGASRPIGSFGVAIFFVISGFIMAMICDTNPQHFMARRIARIVPLYWLLTLAVAMLALLAPRLLGSTTVNSISLLKSLFFVPYKTNGAYFPVLFLGWSLNYEMYFYVLIAVGLLIHKRAAAFIAAAAMTAIFAAIRYFHVTGAINFYSQPVIFEFVLGIVCYYSFLAVRIRSVLAVRWSLLCAVFTASLSMIAASIYANGNTALLLVGMASTVLVLSAVLLDKADWSLHWRFLLLLGDASYVIYLIHPYCQQVINKLIAPRLPILATNTILGMPFALAITVVVSLLVYRLVDDPLHQFVRNLLSGTSPRLLPGPVPSLSREQIERG